MEDSTIEIKVKVMEGADLMVNSRLSDSVEELKRKIQAMSAIPIEHQRLIFRGRVLENNKTLRECDLENEDTIFLVKQTVLDGLR